MSENLTCPQCGIYFGVPEHWVKSRREDKQTFYCPNGHSQSFKESETERLRRERDRLKQDNAYLESQRMEAEAKARRFETANKKLKKRTAAGTCPCCQRTFSNMAQHMKHMHPDFVQETGAKVIAMKVAK